jgi:hypothetical protein
MNDRPAFPTNESSELNLIPGMTLREYAAIKAMQGIVARTGQHQDYTAKDAVKCADALIAELAKEKAS